MPYGSSHTSTLPTVGATPGPTYATQINAAISEIRATIDSKVTPAGFDMSSDLSFLSSGTYRAATNLERANFQNKSAVISAGTYPTALFVANGELYFNDNSSRQIQVTNAGTVNVTTTGGITGSGYGSGGVEVNWDAGTTEFRFRSGTAADNYGDVKCDDVLLNDGSGNFVRVTAQSMAADYTVTLPAAAPASTLPVVMDTAGVLSTTGTLANLVTFTTSGNGTVGGAFTSTGLITATAGVTAAAGQHFTVSSTGAYKHGDIDLIISAAEFRFNGGDPFDYGNGDAIVNWGGAGSILVAGLTLELGKRVKVITVYALFNSTDSKTVSFIDSTTGTRVTQSDTRTTNYGATPGYTLTLTLSPQVTITNGHSYTIKLQGGAATDDFYHVKVTYDHP